MAFIDKTFILQHLSQDAYDEITDGDDTMIDPPINQALDFIREYLGTRYDIDAIFAEADTTKYVTLRKIAVDIAIYNLYSYHVSPKHVPDHRMLNYEHGCDVLKKYAKGDIGDGLPEITAAEGEAREKAVTHYQEFKKTRY